MKREQKLNRKSKIVRSSILLLLLVALAGCSKEDDQDSFIKTQAAVMTFTEINNCTFPGDVKGTTYLTTIKYEATKGTEITKLLIDNEWSDGFKDSWESTNFTTDSGELLFSSCFGFEDADWIKTSYTLVSKEGVKSNPSIGTITKPNGAD